jgi:hypothetical protein
MDFKCGDKHLDVWSNSLSLRSFDVASANLQ